MTGCNIVRNTDWKWVIFAAIFAVAAVFVNLGSDGIYAAQEGRTAIILRNMLRSGNWIDMNVEGGIPYEKPIGHYWLTLPSAAVFGLDGDPHVSSVEWAVRMPSALSALVALAAAGILAGRIYSRRAGAFTVIVLATMPNFDKLARLAHIDMPLTAAMAAAMLFLYIGYFEKRRVTGWLYAFYAMLGWGLLLKGPVAVILPGLAVLGMMVYRRDWSLIWKLRPLTGGLLVLAVALPWYAIETLRTGGDFFDEFIVNQNLRRFTGIGSTYRDGKRMPIWYYFPKFMAGTAPWCAVAVVGMIGHAPRLFRMKLRDATIFLLIWLFTGFVFFSLSALKRGDYLLPIYPAAACLVGALIDRDIDRLPALSAIWRWIWGGIGVILAAMLTLNLCGFFVRFGELIVNGAINVFSERDGMSMKMISEFVNAHLILTLFGAVAVMALLWLVGILLEKRRAESAFAVVSGIILCFFMAYHAAIEPGTDKFKTVKDFAAEVRRIVPPGARIDYIGDYNTEFIFFVDRPLIRGADEPGDYVVASPEVARHMRGDAPGVWRVAARTVEDHQYPALLLIRNRR